jgi:hypothetical protein
MPNPFTEATAPTICDDSRPTVTAVGGVSLTVKFTVASPPKS